MGTPCRGRGADVRRFHDVTHNGLTAKAAFTAAKDAAERALEDALSTERERAARKAEEAEKAKRRRKKRLVLAVLGLVIVLGVVGLALRYWYWFLLLGLAGIVALYARHRWRRFRAGRREKEAEVPAKKEPRELSAPPAPRLAPPEPAGPSVEDELAELKARLKK